MTRLSSLFLAAALSAPAVVVAQAPQPPAPVKHTEDDRIYDEVRRRLANDVDVKGAGIDVAVKNGVVTLVGNVHNERGKEKAEKLTKKVKGVTGVENKLVVAESEK
jgi:osmotically-inducible protein OsmY